MGDKFLFWEVWTEDRNVVLYQLIVNYGLKNLRDFKKNKIYLKPNNNGIFR